ncbi:uncharacterized protein EAE97_010814 [Botrytis byssoidea]|uniref:Uncharacterized protein n=1 Tax=Botrytis byssoidea TaxID=139641 RepID=A0A9P5I089_9HELO|nr:uncharacterized protein EAE97_010814 [Botrytis byssoidea]KAF7923376.1 hypothetical protein EAE97_010814 [Botrytis byssoidea]
MVSFEKFFIAISLLFNGIAAFPTQTGTLSIAATDVRAVNDFAIESRDLKHVDARAKPKKKCGATKRNGLEPRILYAGTNANQVLENEYVDAMQIKSNGGKATVADLSGCTALFFYMGTTLRRAVLILCGNEETDAKTAMQAAIGADSITIGAKNDELFEAVQRGIRAIKPNFTFNRELIYKVKEATDTTAITLSSVTGATTLTKGTGPRICRQSQ